MNTIVVIVDQSTKMIQLKATTTNISSEGMEKFIETKFGNYIGSQEIFSATKDYNSHPDSWKNL